MSSVAAPSFHIFVALELYADSFLIDSTMARRRPHASNHEHEHVLPGCVLRPLACPSRDDAILPRRPNVLKSLEKGPTPRWDGEVSLESRKTEGGGGWKTDQRLLCAFEKFIQPKFVAMQNSREDCVSTCIKLISI